MDKRKLLDYDYRTSPRKPWEPMKHMFRAIRRVMDEHPDVKAIYPLYMNPVVRETTSSILADADRVHIIERLDVLGFHNFLSRSYLILMDSSGIQEEAPAWVNPCLSCAIQQSGSRELLQGH